MVVRIHGLVRAHKILRTQLQHGIPVASQSHFRQEVQQLLRRIEDICSSHRITPYDLPAPSRQAYQSLKAIDLHKLPPPSQHTPLAPRPLRIPGLLHIGQHLTLRIWQQLDPLALSSDAQRQLRIEIATHATQIETLCQQQQQTPSALEEPSQRVYAWLCFLSRQDHFSALLQALLCVRKRAKSLPPFPKPLRIEIFPMQALWRTRVFRDELLLRCNPGFLDADESLWDAILCSAFAHATTEQKQLVRAYADHEDYQDIQLTLEAFLPQPPASTRGQHHHLCESFLRVNHAFFQNQLTSPQLRWSHRPTSRILGHYLSSHDQVMISTSLDHPDVPRFVFDFVMFHELLHKKHGASYQQGRRIVHSNDFLDEERTYPRYHEAESFLRSWARDHLRGK